MSVKSGEDQAEGCNPLCHPGGKTLGEAMSELNAISNKILPDDYTTRYKGMAEPMGNHSVISFLH